MCGKDSLFLPEGTLPRYEARCPHCHSLERHRLFALWLATAGDMVDGKDLLHFAPEPQIAGLVRPRAATYRSADIEPGRADLVIDIEHIALDDGSIDLVICNHVLEHVDHRAALAEIMRILRPGGAAVLSFPIIEGWDETYDIGPLPERERILHYGQKDHVRFFGRDVRDDIRAAGFALSEFTAVEPYVHRHGLLRGDKAFIARKPA